MQCNFIIGRRRDCDALGAFLDGRGRRVEWNANKDSIQVKFQFISIDFLHVPQRHTTDLLSYKFSQFNSLFLFTSSILQMYVLYVLHKKRSSIVDYHNKVVVVFSLFKFIKMFSIQIDTSTVNASAKMKVVKI